MKTSLQTIVTIFLVFLCCANLHAQSHNAASFDGANDYLSVSNSLGNFPADFTIEVHVKTTTAKTFILDKRSSCTNQSMINLQLISGKLIAEISDGTTAGLTTISTNTTINDNVM